MSDPFRITGPAIISFSGGRTSAYMLHRIIQAHGGTLPDDVIPVFANTGREMPATLDFVRDCSAAWGINVVWLEFTGRRTDGFQAVNHNSAARLPTLSSAASICPCGPPCTTPRRARRKPHEQP